MQTSPTAPRALLALASVLSVVGCSNGTGTDAQSANSAASAGGLFSPTGALQCAPSTKQLDACSGMDAGAGCSLAVGWDGGVAWPGTCHSTLDGTQVACVPNPPTPPSALVNACTGKAAGAVCTAEGAFGGSFQGTCLTPPGGTPLFCGHVHTPPAGAVAACAGADAGDACTRPGRWGWNSDAGTKPGVCSAGPADAGPLACIAVRPSESPGVQACAGLDAGAGCTLGFGHRHDPDDGPSGSCVVPAAGGPATCLVPCEALHPFHRHPMEHGGGWGGGGPWGPWAPSDAGTFPP